VWVRRSDLDSGAGLHPTYPTAEERCTVTVRSTLTTNPVNSDVALFANAAVDAEVEITLPSSRAPDDEIVTIFFGDERVGLQFYDVESLERLREVADEVAGNACPVAATGDRPVKLLGGGVR
jgi:hypothetical protein